MVGYRPNYLEPSLQSLFVGIRMVMMVVLVVRAFTNTVVTFAPIYYNKEQWW